MQTKVTPGQKMKRQVNFIFLANCISNNGQRNVNIGIYALADPGDGPGGTEPPPPYSPYFLDQTEA